MKTVAIFGGTFDPIHNGHVHSALELKQRLSLSELRLLPCHIPPHRDIPGASGQQRLAMTKLAVEGTGLLVDARELNKDGYSYTVETLEQIREELEQPTSLLWVMGSDAFAELDTWYRWQDLLSLAHIVVMARPDQTVPECGPVAELAANHRAERVSELQDSTAGLVWFESLTPYPVSATAIRETLAKQGSVAHYLPTEVENYIHNHRLYAG